MHFAYRSFFCSPCVCIEIGPITLPCLSSSHRFKSRANIRGTAVLRGRAGSKKESHRSTILTTKAADTKAPELLIRQFLCTRRAARCYEDIKLAILYRHRRPILRLVPISIIEQVSCPPVGRSFSLARWNFFSSPFYFFPWLSPRMTMSSWCLSLSTSENLIK